MVAFAEEEGQRYKATFLGSGALVGQFNPSWLAQLDAHGISMQTAMAQAGLAPQDIASLQRDPAKYLGFVEVHIEQGPVLNELNLPLGIVTSINGSVRLQCEVIGMASHAGTTPMNRRRDAAAAVAELSVYLEQRAAQDATAWRPLACCKCLMAPSMWFQAAACSAWICARPRDAQRDALVNDILAQLEGICDHRGVRYTLEETMRASAAPSDALWQTRWENAVTPLGVPIYRMPSGAGHDAMKLHEIMPQAMLFVRGENSGISHNPLESTTSDDMQLGVQAFQNLLTQLASNPV